MAADDGPLDPPQPVMETLSQILPGAVFFCRFPTKEVEHIVIKNIHASIKQTSFSITDMQVYNQRWIPAS